MNRQFDFIFILFFIKHSVLFIIVDEIKYDVAEIFSFFVQVLSGTATTKTIEVTAICVDDDDEYIVDNEKLMNTCDFATTNCHFTNQTTKLRTLWLVHFHGNCP